MAVTEMSVRSFCSPTSPCPECTGVCDVNADCQDGLTCQLRDAGRASPTSCARGGDVDGHNYCVVQPSTRLPYLTLILGVGTRPACAGNSNADSDFQLDLVCVSRIVDGRLTTPHGCSPGGAGDDHRRSYCVESTSKLLVDIAVTELGVRSFCSLSSPCSACNGNCNTDADCQEGLTCEQRDRALIACEYQQHGYRHLTRVCVGLVQHSCTAADTAMQRHGCREATQGKDTAASLEEAKQLCGVNTNCTAIAQRVSETDDSVDYILCGQCVGDQCADGSVWIRTNFCRRCAQKIKFNACNAHRANIIRTRQKHVSGALLDSTVLVSKATPSLIS